MDWHSVCKTRIIPGMFMDQCFITAFALKSFVHFDYPARFLLLWCAASVLMWECERQGIFRQPTPHCQPNECLHNTSRLHHGVQQKSNPGWAFSPISYIKQRSDYRSWSGGEALHHTSCSLFPSLLSHLLIFTSPWLKMLCSYFSLC